MCNVGRFSWMSQWEDAWLFPVGHDWLVSKILLNLEIHLTRNSPHLSLATTSHHHGRLQIKTQLLRSYGQIRLSEPFRILSP